LYDNHKNLWQIQNDGYSIYVTGAEKFEHRKLLKNMANFLS